MAFIDLGKLKFNWQGTWNSGTAYETDDVVFHGSQTFVATADVAAGQAEPQANTSWSLMAAGFNYRGTYASGTTYYLHDVVTYGSALYMLEGIAETGNQTGIDPGSNPGSDNWEQLTPAPAANVMHQIGDMVYRNNANANTRLVITEQAGVGITAQEQPLETYTSRAFTYTLNGSNGNVINTAGSIPAVTYSITTKNQRADNYVIDGTDRDGDINWEYDGIIRINQGDIINFDNTLTHGSHPMAIRVADGGASVTQGTYSGEGTASVSWNTLNVTPGTYYYQCTNHAGMIGQIIVESTENRQGSAGANGTMQVCRGKTYTITLDGLNNGVSYNLFNAAAPQSGTGNAISSGEGNSAPGGTAYSGSPTTFTFTPNETTPDTVYITSAANSNDQVEITVNDLAFVPSWGTAAPDNQLVLDDSDSSNTFTLTTGNQSANRTWVLPTAAPSANQMIQFAADGTITYREAPKGYIEATAFYNNLRAQNSAAVANSASSWVRCKITNEEWDHANIATFSTSTNAVTITNAGTYEIQFIYMNNYGNGGVSRLFNDTTSTQMQLSQPTYSGQYYNQHFSCRGYWRGTLAAGTQIAQEVMQQTNSSYGMEYSYWTNQGNVWEHGMYITKLVT